MYFDFTYNNIILALLVLSIMTAAILIIFYRRRIRSICRHEATSPDAVTPVDPSQFPALSIIVYDKESPTALSRILAEIYAQNYPAQFEIIVTSDGNSPDSADVVNLFAHEHNNIRLTFVPDDAHALSRKKLAITLGVKAAKNECIVLTEADCMIESTDWLASFGSRFASGHTLIIAHAAPMDKSGRQGSAMQSFDTLATDVTYLSSAIANRPYRANSSNLGFTRRLFFDNKGFANSVGLHHGEDDIFISRIAPYAVTSVILSDDATINLQVYDFARYHRLSKLSHNFTGRHVSHASRRLFGLFSLSMWIWLAATIALAIESNGNLAPATLSLAIGIAWMWVAISSWRKASRVLRIGINMWLMPILMFARPIYNIIYRMRGRSFADHNYTWSKP